MILKYVNKNYYTVRQVLKQEFNMSNNLLTDLRKTKSVFLNTIPTYYDAKIYIDDVICADIDFYEDCNNIVPIEMKLDILYEDEFLLIINKPSGIPVHPSMDHFQDSLSNGIKFYFDSINLKKKIRPVNRLDKNTSGIVVFAKNSYTHDRLSFFMQNNLFKKEYVALCEGFFEKKSGTVVAPISRKENSIIERCVSLNGTNSITHYDVLEEFSFSKHNISRVHFVLETGRTHQIRVHMAYLGHPIVGDTLYGSNLNFFKRQALHSYKIEFIHPFTRKIFNLTCEPPF